MSDQGVHWYLCRQIPKKLNGFVQTANSLALPNEFMTNVAWSRLFGPRSSAPEQVLKGLNGLDAAVVTL